MIKWLVLLGLWLLLEMLFYFTGGYIINRLTGALKSKTLDGIFWMSVTLATAITCIIGGFWL